MPAGFEPRYDHEDRLAALHDDVPLNRKLHAVHRAVKERHPFVARIAVAAYDPALGTLKTFLASSGEAGEPLTRYEARLDDAPSLRAILERNRPRVVNDLAVFERGRHEHTKAIRRAGYRASYTMPIRLNGSFWGFVFFNSEDAGVFTEEVLRELDPFGHLAAALTVADLMAVRVLAAAVRSAQRMVHLRDPETGAHLERMGEYAKLIARELPGFDDEALERLRMFAPLHDLGKLGVPDRLLLKPGRLDDAEREEMKAHPALGLVMIDRIVDAFGLGGLAGVDMLRNVAAAHHEAMDGSGYPKGLKGAAIPIEARIVSVADVFDALTSARPYKPAWTNDEAFATLRRLAPEKLDADCVDALLRRRSEVEAVQARFADAGPGA